MKIIKLLMLWCVIAGMTIIIYSCAGEKTNDSEDGDAAFLRVIKLTEEAYGLIRYGKGDSNLFFYDEIVSYGEGHCGHYVRLLAKLLTENGFGQYEIVSIETYNKRSHAVMQVDIEGTKYVLDPSNGVAYPHSISKLIGNPGASSDIIGPCKYKLYCNEDFWGSVNKLEFIPYIRLNSLNTFIASDSLNELTDSEYNSKKKFKGDAEFVIDFDKQVLVSSVVLFTHKSKSNKSFEVSVFECIDNEGDSFKPKFSVTKTRSITSINTPEGLLCNTARLQLRSSSGFEVRDIQFFGRLAY